LEDIYSIIDVGTNNVLLLIASLTDHLKIIKRDSKISAMGKDMKDNIIDITAINRTRMILTNFITMARKYTKNIIILGTSCSRDAKNISLLSNWLENEYQLKYHIISGDEEARFNGLANINEFNEFKNIIMFDVGGGSTEFVWIKDGIITQTQSIDLGIRRLQNKFDNDYQGKYSETQRLLTSLSSTPFENYILIGIGGTSTSLSAMKFQLENYDPGIVHKSKVTISELRNILSDLRGKTTMEIEEIMPFEPKRADIIATGTMIVTEILDYFERTEFLVSDRGIQFGILTQDKQDLDKMLS